MIDSPGAIEQFYACEIMQNIVKYLEVYKTLLEIGP